MTKEELVKEAEESAKKFFGKPTDLVDLDNLRIFKNGYLAGAEPREKRIDCLTLACENYREEMEKNLADAVKLEKENAELEAQIEKMKCCYNCSKDCGSIDRRVCFENKMKDWEIKEK